MAPTELFIPVQKETVPLRRNVVEQQRRLQPQTVAKPPPEVKEGVPPDVLKEQELARIRKELAIQKTQQRLLKFMSSAIPLSPTLSLGFELAENVLSAEQPQKPTKKTLKDTVTGIIAGWIKKKSF